MSTSVQTEQPGSSLNVQQVVKWTVYSLLLVNFAYYILEDWHRASLSLPEAASVLQWAGAFATSIDELGWFILLFMFELETYILEDEKWTSRMSKVVHGVRFLCMILLAHTVFAYSQAFLELRSVSDPAPIQTLCDIQATNASYVFNLEYTAITASNCSKLSEATTFYAIPNSPVFTDAAGLRLEKRMGYVDLWDAISWLLVVLKIEIMVRLQERGVTRGATMRALKVAKSVFYSVLLVDAAFWAYHGHWVYCWDQLLWIGGFAAIELNLANWREELMGQSDAAGG